MSNRSGDNLVGVITLTRILSLWFWFAAKLETIELAVLRFNSYPA
jgi:hypothetical protein